MMRVTTQWSGVAGTPWFTVTAFTASPEDQAAADAAVSAMAAFWTAVGAGVTSEARWDMDPIVDVLSPAGVLTGRIDSGVTSGAGGGQASSPLPFMTQALLRLGTGSFQGGREIQGRIFIPGLTEADSQDGTGPASGLRNIILSAAETLRDSGAGLAVWSRVGQAVVPVTNVSVSPVWSYLGSRLH